MRCYRFLLLVTVYLVIVSTSQARPEIWIAQRSDGRAGTGSQKDPYDGSTSALLDPILRRALDTADMIVHFGKGTFYTQSVLASDPVCVRQAQVTIQGAGMDRTTLALDPALAPRLPAWAFFVLQSEQHITPDSYTTVQDLTLDTSWPRMKNPRTDVAIGNVNLVGNHCSLIRVRGRNPHGDNATGKECFALTIGAGGPYDLHDALITDCVAEKPRGDYVNGITINGWTFDIYPATNARGLIRNCRADNFRADHKHMAAFAIASGILTNCSAKNSTVGVYMECARDLTISHCDLRGNIWRGVWICPANNYGGVRNVKVLDSTIEISDFESGAAGIDVGSGDEKNRSEEIVISDNTFLRRGDNSANKAYSVISAAGVPGLSVTGNRIQGTLDQSALRQASSLGNVSLGGAPLSSLPDVLVTNADAQFLSTPAKAPRVAKKKLKHSTR